MAERRAIDLALDLARMPALARIMRKQVLPADLLDVIRIAAGCPEVSEAALAATHEPLSVIRAAAVFYLEEMLFFPDAGLHRNLGVAPGASRAQMRLHMRWLLQWLHPDHNPDETAGLLAQRVIKAWRELGRRERADANPESMLQPRPESRQSPVKKPTRPATIRLRWIAVPLQSPPAVRRSNLRSVIFVLAAAVAAASVLFPDAIVASWVQFIGAAFSSTPATAEGGGGVFVDAKRRD